MEEGNRIKDLEKQKTVCSMIVSVSRRNLVPPAGTDELLPDETPGAGGQGD